MEEGSPLLVYGKRLEKQLQTALGSDYTVALAMRYQQPALQKVLSDLSQLSLKQLVVIPLFPQYASATTGSVHQAVMSQLQAWNMIPELSFINNYATHPAFIAAFADRLRQHHPASYDHIVFSFHGLPERHIRKADRQGSCLQSDCCRRLSCVNANCYSAQCHATARAIAAAVRLDPHSYTVCFQSRLGKEPWLTPYTSDVLHRLAQNGVKRLLVLSPAFVADCLETIGEIGIEYAEEFTKNGGEVLDLVPSLNDSPLWVEALRQLVLERTVLTVASQSNTLQLLSQQPQEEICLHLK
jgi:ferrochelatase